MGHESQRLRTMTQKAQGSRAKGDNGQKGPVDKCHGPKRSRAKRAIMAKVKRAKKGIGLSVMGQGLKCKNGPKLKVP